MHAFGTAFIAGALLTATISHAQSLSVGGSYPTTASLVEGKNTCGAVTVMDNPTFVAHTAGQHTLTLTHAGTTHDATIEDNGAFVATPKVLNVGGARYDMLIDGTFTTTGLNAIVTLHRTQATAPTDCTYLVSWTGTKQGTANVIPGHPRDGRSVVVRRFAGTGADESIDGPLSSASFAFPVGIASNRRGTLFVAGGSVIRRITAEGVVSTVAGSAGEVGFRDGVGPDARFSALHGIVVDRQGNLFVVDNSNHAVRRIALDGAVTTFAGNGSPGSTDGTGSAARFNSPHGLAIDANDNLYVADVANHTIRRITSAGVVTTFAGSAGQRGGADGAGVQARFEFPSAIEVDSAGNVWVGGNGAIRRIAPDGQVTTIAGVNGAEGTTDGVGTAARFQGPEALAFAPNGDLYIASGSALRRMDPQVRVTTVAGFGAAAGDVEGIGSLARLALPLGLVFDEERILIADARNNRIYSAVVDNLNCTPATTRLCIGENRFAVRLPAEEVAIARSVNPVAGFFSQPEIFVKAIGNSITYGGFANESYTMTVHDVTTGKSAAIVHEAGSACGGFRSEMMQISLGEVPRRDVTTSSRRRRPIRGPLFCPANASCWFDGRLRITVEARNTATNARGAGLPLAGTSGVALFSVPSLSGSSAEPELFLKVLSANGTFTLLHGGLTRFEYTILVADQLTQQTREFTQAAGTPCGDTSSF